MIAVEKKTKKTSAVKTPKEKAEIAPVVSTGEFAVIATGGKQYVVSVGSVIKIEKMPGDHKEGEAVVFDKVLVVDNGSETTLGAPHIEGATVTGKLQKIARDRKVEIIKYKQKSRYFVRRGHRQPYFLVKIESIK